MVAFCELLKEVFIRKLAAEFDLAKNGHFIQLLSPEVLKVSSNAVVVRFNYSVSAI